MTGCWAIPASSGRWATVRAWLSDLSWPEAQAHPELAFVRATGASFVHDLHVVFPNMRIVALSKSPKLLAAALKAGASVALPSSTPSPTLAAVIARLLEQP